MSSKETDYYEGRGCFPGPRALLERSREGPESCPDEPSYSPERESPSLESRTLNCDSLSATSIWMSELASRWT